ncbi:hypothetical protein [Nesterenkonia haasae]|uniref:hypothetical protein n=1 Tax=Nesterenkonia haasae TaxID=2587813 RepID=UPI00139186AC|nr:hypothetical protein [Nesterenkonia haasae]NDK31167.1 hypothetical protein [Nesterenkonia haasae]
MKPTRIAAMGGIAVLGLAGCGAESADGADRIEALETQVQELQQQLEEMEQQQPTSGGLFEEREFNSRMTGDVEAAIGEVVEVDLGPFENENNYAGTVALTSIEFVNTCNDYESEVGQFAYLGFDISADDEAEDAIDFNSNAFRWDDYHYALSTPESLACELDLGHQDPIEPGESGQYTAVWEVPSTSATLQWREPTYIVSWEITGEDNAEAIEGPDEDVTETEPPNGTDSSNVSFDDCDEAWTHWGGIMNDELDGQEIDGQELADIEDWINENGCH